VRELHTADVLRKISIATTAGRPVSGALSTMARYHFDPTIRHNLLFVRNEVEQGADVWESMRAADMLTPPEVRVLATAERVGNRPWALKQLAFAKIRRTRWRLERLSELVLPAVVILIGAFVLIQALSIFLLLTQLIHELA
jgi:general secretion pathway protein F/type IV pilus assembly protein PilC